MIRSALLAFIALAAAPLAAKDLSLGLPIDCTLGQSCFVQQFVDRDPGPAHRDYSCNSLTYQGHKGTDFALPSLAAMAAGVDVLASADGVVAGFRNDMLDVIQGVEGAPDISGKECGNGVVIKHNGGWETQYCHLKQGSVIVTRGQKVAQGEVLGQVGLSGQTEFPHVHLSVRKNGAVIDPYDADQILTCGGADQHSLWQTEMPYIGAGMISVGFGQALPKYAAIKAGTAHSATLPTHAPALVLWGYAYGGQQGDVIELSINGPNGEIIKHQVVLEKTQSQLFRAAGKRNKGAGWPAGRYLGVASLIRDGQMLDRIQIDLMIK